MRWTLPTALGALLLAAVLGTSCAPAAPPPTSAPPAAKATEAPKSAAPAAAPVAAPSPAAAPAAAASPPAAAQTGPAGSGRKLNIGLSYQAAPSDSDPWHFMAQRWQALLKERTAGNIEIQLFPGGQLSGGNQQKEIELVQNGSIQASILPTGTLSVIDPRFQVIGLPWIVPNEETGARVIDGRLGEETLSWVRAKQMEPLAIGSNGFRQLANRRRAVTKPEDLQGLKLRVPGSKVLVETWKALGAEPVVVNFAELYTALQQGTVDGEELPWVFKFSTKFYEVEKYGTQLNYSFDLIYLLFNRQLWDSFAPADQEVLRATAQEAARAEREFLSQSDRGVIEKLKAEGMEITTLTSEQIAAFQARMPSVYAQFAGDIGQDVIDRFRAGP
jgi:tripartite ATP-independent transporter DctP family solute receptor